MARLATSYRADRRNRAIRELKIAWPGIRGRYQPDPGHGGRHCGPAYSPAGMRRIRAAHGVGRPPK